MTGPGLRRFCRSAASSVALGLALPSPGCERSTTALPPESVGASRAPRLATPTAFDLVPAPGGAVLAWAAPDEGAISVQRFDRDGLPRHEASSATRVSGVGNGVADLALTALASAVALAWSEPAAPSDPGARLRGAWIAAGGEARTFELGPGFRAGDASRGALALVARDGAALLLARGLAAPCSDVRDSECSSFRFFELGPDAARATGLGLTVPRPCTARSAQLVTARLSAAGEAGPLEYAICAGRGGATALTVFSIQPSPAYAAAEEALVGCEPLGAGRFGGEATFVGSCEGRRRSVSVAAEGGALVVRDLDQRGLICNAGGAVVRFGQGWLRPSEPIGDLELLLNDDLAPLGARAVWTGASLLVAQVRDGALALSRHGCRGARLVELDPPHDAGSPNRD